MGNEKKKLLFICTAASHRSVTAARLFDDSERYEAKFAGTGQYAKVKISQELIDWADEIFTLDEKNDGHKTFLENNFTLGEKLIRDLGIPDIYPTGHPKLKQLLREKLADHL